VDRAEGVALDVDLIGAVAVPGREDEAEADAEADADAVAEVEGLTSSEVEATGFLGGILSYGLVLLDQSW